MQEGHEKNELYCLHGIKLRFATASQWQLRSLQVCFPVIFFIAVQLQLQLQPQFKAMIICTYFTWDTMPIYPSSSIENDRWVVVDQLNQFLDRVAGAPLCIPRTICDK